MVRNGARVLVSKCFCQVSRLVSSKVPRLVSAAEFTSALTLPNFSNAVAIRRVQSSAFESSACTNKASVPIAFSFCAADSPFVGSRPLMTILIAPSSASRLATAKPRP